LRAPACQPCSFPLPIGNGEQALNAEPVVAAGGCAAGERPGVDQRVRGHHVVDLLADVPRLRDMSVAARELVPRDADERLARMVLETAEPLHEGSHAAQVTPVQQVRRVHFVGIGGAGLSGIARIMLAHGVDVSGSDATDSPTLSALRERGARCVVGHAAEHVGDAEVVVVSTAVREDNPEVVEARRRAVAVWSRAAALVSCMSGYRVLAVAGTHGKTTTTAMLTTALLHAGADPTYAIGADLTSSGINAALGSGKDFVVEADESDGAFLAYAPLGAIVTNVDADHLDVWGSELAYRQAFTDFLGRILAGGFLIACIDDPGAAALAAQARDRGIEVVTVALDVAADLRAVDVMTTDGLTTASVVRDGEALGQLRLQVPGRHYAVDALAALAMGLRLGHPAGPLLEGLAAFSGSRRRMEAKARSAVCGYATPTPITRLRSPPTSRRLARWLGWTPARVLPAASGEPHEGPRSADGRRPGGADLVVVCDIYVAREDPEEGVSGLQLAAAVPLPRTR
jgi:UDP-N-acetylmuramate--alanine ligase